MPEAPLNELKEYWVTFHCHYDALRFRTMCTERALECRLASVPRSLSSSCGTAARVYSPEAPDFFPDAEALYQRTAQDRFVPAEV